MINKIKILWYKHQARSATYEIHHIGDNLNCGHHIAEIISPAYCNASLKRDRAIKMLRKSDPEFPK